MNQTKEPEITQCFEGTLNNREPACCYCGLTQAFTQWKAPRKKFSHFFSLSLSIFNISNQMKISSGSRINRQNSLLVITGKKTNWGSIGLNAAEASYIRKQMSLKENFIQLNQLKRHVMIQLTAEFEKKNGVGRLEFLRGIGHKACGIINANKYSTLQIAYPDGDVSELMAVAEGCALSNYEFLKYKNAKKDKHYLKSIEVIHPLAGKKSISEMQILIDAVYRCRDLVNEPQSWLNSVKFAEEMQELGKSAGFSVEVLQKKQIEALKMGGLLAVNRGSVIPPTFTIMEWKPANAVNKKPIILVGKGVVYDTGGLSLKPTPNSMDSMKCDMAGGALVACAIYAISKMGIPVHIIGLVPATDNRPGGDAYTPGDVIYMYDGQTVEVLNTDAEGRMLLADALAYAKKYKPELVLDFATLTGAASAAIGPYGIVCMGTATDKYKNSLKESGDRVYERLVEFPFWDEYAKLIKSDLADMKNIGGPVGGAITAGKFLEKFTSYNWMHFDIAGPAYVTTADSYRGKNATGYGVRLIVDFIRKMSVEG